MSPKSTLSVDSKFLLASKFQFYQLVHKHFSFDSIKFLDSKIFRNVAKSNANYADSRDSVCGIQNTIKVPEPGIIMKLLDNHEIR